MLHQQTVCTRSLLSSLQLSQGGFAASLLEAYAVISLHRALHSLILADLEHHLILAMLDHHAYKEHLSVLC